MRGLRLGDLGERAGVERSRLLEFERGVLFPDSLDVTRLALALGVPRAFFERSARLELFRFDEIHFRSMRAAHHHQRIQAASIMGLWMELLDEMGRDVTLRTDAIERVVEEVHTDSSRSPEEVAACVRETWCFGSRPIHNLLQVLESKGAVILPLPDVVRAVGAFSFWYRSYPVLCLDLTRAPAQVCLDAACQFGHLLMHLDVNSSAEQEARSRQFARVFLLPRVSFEMSLPRAWSGSSMRELQMLWRAPHEVILERSYELGCLTRSAQTRALELLRRSGLEGGSGWELGPPRLIRTWLELVSQCKSLKELASALAIHPAELERLAIDLPVVSGVEALCSGRPELRLV